MNSKLCAACGVPFTPPKTKQRFCSYTCSAAVRKRAEGDRACEVCGAGFHVPPTEVRRGRGRFCSRDCAVEGRARDIDHRSRFWSKVNKSGPVQPHTPDLGPCWSWLGSKNEDGYGICIFARDTKLLAHRAAWAFAFGDVPNDLCVCHKCDNRSCVNPKHLFLGTVADNNADKKAKGRCWQPRLRGGRPVAKLSAAQVLEIRRLLRGDQTMRSIAERFGVTPMAIYHIRIGKTWTQLPEEQP